MDLTKAQCVAILRRVTGSGRDYARTSIETYRHLVDQLDPADRNEAMEWLHIEQETEHA